MQEMLYLKKQIKKAFSMKVTIKRKKYLYMILIMIFLPLHWRIYIELKPVSSESSSLYGWQRRGPQRLCFATTTTQVKPLAHSLAASGILLLSLRVTRASIAWIYHNCSRCSSKISLMLPPMAQPCPLCQHSCCLLLHYLLSNKARSSLWYPLT